MDINVIFNVRHDVPLILYIAQYFFFTGLSAGSFVISVVATIGGRVEFKPIGKITAVLAPILLIIAPVNLILDLEQPLRFWHLFLYFNWTSPITYGVFLLTGYPIVGLIYAYFLFTGHVKLSKFFGILGVPVAIATHGYTGFILALAKGRALWNTAAMPTIFLISAMVSGIALVVLVAAVKLYFYSKNKSEAEKEKEKDLIFQLGKFMGYTIMADLFLIFSDILVLLTSHGDALEAGRLILTGDFAPLFLGVELFLGSIVPLFVVFFPRTNRSMTALIISCILVNLGVYAMRYVMVVGGQTIPLY